MAFLSALRSCGISLCPWIGPEQIGPALDLGNTHSASPAATSVTSSEILFEPLRCNDAEILLDLDKLEIAAPQVHTTRFMRLGSLNTERDVLGTMVKGITHIQPLAAHNHDGVPKLCPNTTDPIPTLTNPNRFYPRSNTKSPDRWIFAQLLCLAIIFNLGPRCVQRKSFWATLQTMIDSSGLTREPPKSGHFPIPPSRLPAVRSSPHRRSPRIGKLFGLGSLFLYAPSSGTGSSGYFGFGDSGGFGQSPNGTNPGSQWENDMWPNDHRYFETLILTHPGPEGTAGTDDIPGLPTHAQGATAGTPHVPVDLPTPEWINSRPTPPPPPDENAPQQGGGELDFGEASTVTPPHEHLYYTPFPQPGPMRNYGAQAPPHPPAPQPSFHALPSQVPPQPGAPNGAGLHISDERAGPPFIDDFQRLATALVQHAQQGRSLGTSAPPGDAGPDYLRQWISTLGQPDPPVQPDLDERDRRIYARGYTDALRALIAEVVAVVQANPQLAQTEPSTHEREVPASLLPVAPTQSDQVVSDPDPPTVAQEVSNKPGSEPYAPPTPPCDNTDPEPPSETLGAGKDPTTDSQAPHQESEPDTQNVDHHTPETIHAPQPVASSPPLPPPPVPASTSSLVQAVPYPSLPTPAATPVTQGGTNKPHICAICGKAYGRPYLLEDHIASKHRNEKSYVCDFEGCGLRFSTRSNMRKHFNQKHRGSGTPRRNDTNQAGPSS